MKLTLLHSLAIAFTSLGIPAASSGAEPKPLWLIVGAKELLSGAETLIAHREAEGLEIARAAPPVAAALAALPREPAYVLLVGDDSLKGDAGEHGLRGSRHTLYRWRATQPESYVSDSTFGDLDGDGVPEIPVGRLPGRTRASIQALAEKIVAFEKVPVSIESLHIPVWAGNPAYGSDFQANLASNLLRQTLLRDAPAWADLTLLMGNDTDPLSADPASQGALFHEILARGGGLFTGLMGHGSSNAFYSMPHQGAWIRYDSSQTEAISGSHPSAPTLIFACDCGNFAHSQVSLAEALLAAPAGPVAVIAASTQSHPLPNYYSSLCWLEGVDENPSGRLGDLWVATQRRGYAMENPLVEMFLKEIEGKLGPVLDTAQIRKDHLLLYSLLGDPATSLKRPRPLASTFERKGDVWTWAIPSPPPGAQRLVVSHRPPPGPLQRKPRNLTKAEAIALFHETNAALRFRAIEEEAPVRRWSGQVPHARGTLRLVLQTDEALFVAAHSLNDS